MFWCEMWWHWRVWEGLQYTDVEAHWSQHLKHRLGCLAALWCGLGAQDAKCSCVWAVHGNFCGTVKLPTKSWCESLQAAARYLNAAAGLKTHLLQRLQDCFFVRWKWVQLLLEMIACAEKCGSRPRHLQPCALEKPVGYWLQICV